MIDLREHLAYGYGRLDGHAQRDKMLLIGHDDEWREAYDLGYQEALEQDKEDAD